MVMPHALLAVVALLAGEAPCPEGKPLAPPDTRPAFGPDVVVGTPVVWARAEALAWWVQGAKLPALATAGPPGGPARVVVGDQSVNGDVRGGARFEGGFWLGPDLCD